MSLALKLTSGPMKEESFPLRNAMTIGRVGADISLNDPKVSTVHARIVQNDKGEWLLRDNSSKNGLRVDGEKVTEVVLTEGMTFLVADIEFKVVPYSGLDIEIAIPAPAKKQKTWYQILSQLVDAHMKGLKDENLPIVPMEPAVVLDFLRGSQVSSRWVLGYGPREIGSTCPDLPIWEPGAPEVCFELIPEPDGVYFRTKHPEVVRLNGSAVDRQVLRVGDTIQIHDTVIEVDFSE
jgi:pSer/pThr/pTyr-binding forkhead associated (FHA) protein